MNYAEAMKHCIFRFRSGSHAYGTNSATSDEDFRGVFIAPLKEAFDLFHTSFVGSGTFGENLAGVKASLDVADIDAAKDYLRNCMLPDQGDLVLSVQTVTRLDQDEELQELRKFLSLASTCNPNIIEFLYVEEPVLVTHETEVWKKIKAKRDLFLSKKAKYTFSGYAIAQLKRIQRHRGYLINPPNHKPTRAEFNLPESTTVAREHYKALLSLPEIWVRDEAKEIVKRERQYAEAMESWTSYQKWGQERNKMRQDLERNYGYDTKHAMHLVRLIRMAKEILTDGTVRVFRPDREELLAIRQGAWKYDDLVSYAEAADKELTALYDKSTLRHQPDFKGISKLYHEICEDHYGLKLH